MYAYNVHDTCAILCKLRRHHTLYVCILFKLLGNAVHIYRVSMYTLQLFIHFVVRSTCVTTRPVQERYRTCIGEYGVVCATVLLLYRGVSSSRGYTSRTPGASLL